MKKLKLSLQNIEGVEVLTRAQLKNVLGGTSLPETTTGASFMCWIKPRDEANNPMEAFAILTELGCPERSQMANNRCVELIITPGSGVYGCGYDCGC